MASVPAGTGGLLLHAPLQEQVQLLAQLRVPGFSLQQQGLQEGVQHPGLVSEVLQEPLRSGLPG